jgi:hypothetical protein
MKNKRIEVSLVLVTALSLLVIATLPACAQPPASANVSIGDITLAPGATATLPIMIDEAAMNISAAQINLTYDPTVVQVTAVVGNPQWDDFFCNDTIDGERRMTGYRWGSELTPPVKFADVTVKAIGNPGDYTPLDLEGEVFPWGHGTPYILYVSNGSVLITAAVPVYNVFGMIALIGLLAIVLAVTVRRR